MKIAVIGAGAIGGLVAGYLKSKNADVHLVAHSDSVQAINEHGLEISGVRGDFSLNIPITQRLENAVDLVILATKTQDLEEAIRDNLALLKNTLILTIQNGLKADALVSCYIPKEKIVSSIVMFGSTYLEPGKILHNFEGAWILGSLYAESAPNIGKIEAVLQPAFNMVVSDKLSGMKLLKVFVNANNALTAILGMSMQEAFSDIEVSRISIAIWKEGFEVIKSSGMELVSLPDFPVERVTKLAALPTQEAAKVFSGMMMGLSKEPVYGSILQSIKRGKPSEIDYINGEFVNLAASGSRKAPLNEKLIDLVHQVEISGKFFSKEELIRQTKGLFN